MSGPQTFWMVWNPQGHAPTRKHQFQTFATQEAERLARQCPGETFIVLESVSSHTFGRMERVDLRPVHDDNHPF